MGDEGGKWGGECAKDKGGEGGGGVTFFVRYSINFWRSPWKKFNTVGGTLKLEYTYLQNMWPFRVPWGCDPALPLPIPLYSPPSSFPLMYVSVTLHYHLYTLLINISFGEVLLFFYSLIHSSIHLFIHLFTLTIIHSSIQLFTYSSIHLFIHLFTLTITHPSIHSYTYSFTYSFTYSCLQLFIHLFMLTIIHHLFTLTIIHSSINAYNYSSSIHAYNYSFIYSRLQLFIHLFILTITYSSFHSSTYSFTLTIIHLSIHASPQPFIYLTT